jgi:hypothetical protein
MEPKILRRHEGDAKWLNQTVLAKVARKKVLNV